MVGNGGTGPGAAGHCRKSCKACIACEKGGDDKECYNANRRKAGFLVFNETELYA